MFFRSLILSLLAALFVLALHNCPATSETDAECLDGLDNDRDTLVDCVDLDCEEHPCCGELPVEPDCWEARIES